MLRRLAAMLLAIGLVVPACSAAPALDDQPVERYIKAYKNIRAVSPQLASQLGKDGVDVGAGQAGFAKIEAAIKAAGFKDYPEFLKVNAAVAWAFSQVQADAFMSEMAKKQQQGQAQIEAVLQDPKVPQAVKDQLRAKQAEAQAQYAKDKGWADTVMGWTGFLTDPGTVEVVQRHREALQRTFQGR